MMRREIGGGAGKEQTVDRGENLRRFERRRQSRNQQWQRARALADRVDIFLADHMEGVVADFSAIADNADDGKSGTHVLDSNGPEASAASRENPGRLSAVLLERTEVLNNEQPRGNVGSLAHLIHHDRGVCPLRVNHVPLAKLETRTR